MDRIKEFLKKQSKQSKLYNELLNYKNQQMKKQYGSKIN
jgi:hypothetical protein